MGKETAVQQVSFSRLICAPRPRCLILSAHSPPIPSCQDAAPKQHPSCICASQPVAGQSRKEPMPYVKIEITRENNTREQKLLLIAAVTQALQDILGKDPATTFVTIDEIDTDNWGIGGELVTDLRQRKAHG
nr:4-oxalocrotonate tautomerase family protein [Deinococcus misasensis]